MSPHVYHILLLRGILSYVVGCVLVLRCCDCMCRMLVLDVRLGPEPAGSAVLLILRSLSYSVVCSE